MTQSGTDSGSHSGMPETMPLMVGILGISIPVALLALAAAGGSVVVLVLAVLSMFVVGGATLAFIFRLATDGPEHDAHSG